MDKAEIELNRWVGVGVLLIVFCVAGAVLARFSDATVPSSIVLSSACLGAVVTKTWLWLLEQPQRR